MAEPRETAKEEPQKQQQFYFINTEDDGRPGSYDKGTRRAIRSHVMQGKNLGRVLKRNSKSLAKTQASSSKSLDEDAPEEIEPISTRKRLQYIEFAGVQFAFPIEPYMLRLLHQFYIGLADVLYPWELCLPFNPGKCVWFQYVTYDAAFLHCTLGISEAWCGVVRGDVTETPLALHHLKESIRLINEKLSGPNSLDDSSLGVVVAFVIHEHRKGNHESSKIHFDGLQRMLDLRGGLTQITQNTALVHKICRTDMDFAMANDTKPVLSWNPIPSMPRLLPPSETPDSTTALQIVSTQLNPQLETILTDLLWMSHLLNRGPKPRQPSKLEPFTFQDILISVQYRLLELSQASPSPTGRIVQDTCCFALLAFSNLFLPHWSKERPSYRNLAGRLRAALEQVPTFSVSNREFMLWVLFIGHLSVFLKVDEVWLFPRAVEVIEALELGSWDEAQLILVRFPWVKLVHDTPGKMLWDELNQWKNRREGSSRDEVMVLRPAVDSDSRIPL